MRGTIIFGVLTVILAASCERDVNNVKLPDFEQKLVINSFISPRDTLSFISVKSNEKLYGFINTRESIGNVSAVLSDGTREISLDTIREGFVFRRRDMPVTEGKTYHLTVTTDKGLYAEAKCTVPLKREIQIEVDTVTVFHDYDDGSGMSWSELKASVFITDYAGEENYYRFACKEILYNSNYSYYPYHFDLYPEEPVVFTDKGNDGERLFINTVILNQPYGDDDSAHIVIYVLLTDKDYYIYHHSLDNYSSSGDPFTEISPAYSNIEGGLGIFASYVVDSLVFRLK